MGYSKRQKQKLIDHLKREREAVATRNEQLLQQRTQQIHQKVMRRLNGVSATLWDVKLVEVLQVERRQKLKARTLIQDILKMRSETLG